MKVIVAVSFVVLVLLVALAYCQWQTHWQVMELQEQLSMRPPLVVLDLEKEEVLKHLPEDLQKKILRLTTAGYLVLQRSQIIAAPDDLLLFHSHEKQH